VHSWKEDEDLTERIISALRNPYVHIIAHPTGRVLKKRPSYRVDIEKVFRVAEEEGKALEINSNPKRVDLDAYVLTEHDYKGLVSINTDAHREWDMDFIFLGCAQASRARIGKERVLNCEESGFLRKFQ
jgi:DNA polymerase (family 10)